MKDRDVHRIIEEQEPELKDRIYKNLENKIDLTSVNNAPIAKKRLRLKYIAGVITGMCIISISILLPFLLRGNNVKSENRYCTQKDYTMQQIDITIQEYALETKKPLLYLNWYENAEEFKTTLYSNINNPNDMICLKEFIVNGETGDIANLYITDQRTTVDFLEPISKLCKDEMRIKDISVNYGIGLNESVVQFYYRDYNYIINFEDVLSTNYIVEIVSNMIK